MKKMVTSFLLILLFGSFVFAAQPADHQCCHNKIAVENSSADNILPCHQVKEKTDVNKNRLKKENICLCDHSITSFVTKTSDFEFFLNASFSKIINTDIQYQNNGIEPLNSYAEYRIYLKHKVLRI